MYNSDNPGMNTDISPGLIPPRTVWKSPMPPTGRSLIGWGSYIIEPAPPGDDKVPSVQGSFHISKNHSNGGRKPSSLGLKPPPTVWKPRFHRLESLIGSSFTVAPHPRRRMIEAHQPMGGGSVAHGGDRAPSPVQKSSKNIYSPSNAGTITMISRVDIPPRTACQPRLHWLISRDWLVGFDPMSSQLFRPSRVFSHTSRRVFSHTSLMRQTIALRAQFMSYLHDRSQYRP